MGPSWPVADSSGQLCLIKNSSPQTRGGCQLPSVQWRVTRQLFYLAGGGHRRKMGGQENKAESGAGLGNSGWGSGGGEDYTPHPCLC